MPARPRRPAVTVETFRTMAVSLPGAAEGSHMGHPDFRIAGRIFATIPDEDRPLGMVRLSPEDQAKFIARPGGGFEPAPGAWGRQGCTYVRLDVASAADVRAALRRAWAERIEASAGAPPPPRRAGRRSPTKMPRRPGRGGRSSRS
ncbi:MAG: MmcQ/YjbR family DNA-binding protein [Phycisphaerae bacterium]|nr:MmcQ/YjbR family DNA-binding protein [Phycisphaerae bacterium]